MDFQLSEEHQAVRDAARDFAQNVLKKGVIERDNEQRFPKDEIKQSIVKIAVRIEFDELEI
jgi:alkylation response protein AidB-like acyl-CoA dehydrogenase